MSEIDFEKIAARGGSVENSFEELCCQLASRVRPAGTRFERYRGDGGDGGVECKTIDATGKATGWQTKYVFEIASLLKQANHSFETALSVHADLSHYVVCFPFDLTTKTGRKGKSETEKFDEWARKAERDAQSKGRALTIERRSATDIRGLLLAQDPSGGLRHYFFFATTFSHQWFEEHLTTAKVTAGPRYNREISIETPLSGWFSSFCAGLDWQKKIENLIKACKKTVARIEESVETKSSDPSRPEWPAAIYEDGKGLVGISRRCIQSAESLTVDPTEGALANLQGLVSQLMDEFSSVDQDLAADLDATHGKGSANSKPFRSFMAEYQCSFPAANLDTVREAQEEWQALSDWLSSPAGFLAFRPVFVLSGNGGSGKTHSLCDIAQQRLAAGTYTCIVFGHQFGGEPDPWTRFAESLGIPLTLGRDGTLDALNAAAECSGEKLVICVDAANETKPRGYWFGRFAGFARAVTARTHLKLCVSCRTSFLPVCLPKDFVGQAVEHEGFAGMEREACNTFFTHYDLEPPLVPVLQPELGNPLYLKLVCETLRAVGLKQLPKGWFGIAPVIRAFLKHKEEQFATEHSISPGSATISGSLRAIAAATAQKGTAALRWSEAQLAIDTARPHARGMDVLQWLVTADLLIEDGPSTEAIGAENVVRPAFERFGDFLVASEMLDLVSDSEIHQAFRAKGALFYLVSSTNKIQENSGVLSALSVLLPEKLPGVELAELIEDASTWEDVARVVTSALSWRSPDTFGTSTQQVIRRVLSRHDAYLALDAMLAVSTQESKIDALWLHEILQRVQFAKRDALWCEYLKLGYEEISLVRRIITAASDLDLHKIDSSTAERWSIVLLWFTAAADRRVKDFATRAATAVLRYHPALLPKLVSLFLAIDDDEVRDRALLIAYGALIQSRDRAAIKHLAKELLAAYAAQPDNFQNASIRDNIRCIAELALQFDCLEPGADPTTSNQRNPKVPQPVPLTEAEEKAWENEKERGTELVIRSCLNDDFNHYSIECLRGWNNFMDKPDIGRWIAKRVLDDFGYRGSKCSDYDAAVVRTTGGGRGKPQWAERIGKKYQWVAMYQLASRLFDSVDREKDSWERTTGRLPLILVEERKLDPTITHSSIPDRKPAECWWVGGHIDLPATRHLDYAAWVTLQDDLPSLDALLAPKDDRGQRWIPLMSSPSWSEYREERPDREPYRHAWMHLKAFLVPEMQFEKAIKAITSRNFFGDWMPRNAQWLHTFVGEYPWASSYNLATDEWLGFENKVRGSDLEYIPALNTVACEWEYDGSLPETIHFHVPARIFFKPSTLWWDSVDGFSTPEGKTVFRDPSASEGGSAALLADLDDLLLRLERLGYRLVWTLLGEKRVLSDHTRREPHAIYSQTAFLNKDGSMTTGERVFFDDYDRDQGLAP